MNFQKLGECWNKRDGGPKRPIDFSGKPNSKAREQIRAITGKIKHYGGRMVSND